MMRKKDLIELGVTFVLLAVLILMFGSASRKRRGGSLAPKTAVLPVTARQVQAEDVNLYNLLEQESRSIELKRDPFTAAPIITTKDVRPGFMLTGILWDQSAPLAIIDGEVVKKGDRVAGKTVEDIKQDGIVLNDGKDFIEIKIEP